MLDSTEPAVHHLDEIQRLRAENKALKEQIEKMVVEEDNSITPKQNHMD